MALAVVLNVTWRARAVIAMGQYSSHPSER
ncbi:hypothetical protein SacmaDRAFT_3040 [Saccharomonospora marina XMU15]|uniref:Uncharacterized protein n=1 Tax=Saccharomonospora marina XMU15 TaxID=882083 RepID=H5X6Q5_9PSEU|nr:hypothetical protein SacmaDRAFT_3040 [Saccharomonospora marina XMU15]